MIKIPTILAAALIGLGLAASPVLAAGAGRDHHRKAALELRWAVRHLRPEPAAARLPGVPGSLRELPRRRSAGVPQSGGSRAARASPRRRSRRWPRPTRSPIRPPMAASVPALPSDHWPSPFATEQDARDPMAAFASCRPICRCWPRRAASSEQFPDWVFNYFTTYSEGGPDYIHALLNGYEDPPPAGVRAARGQALQQVFPGHAIGMPPPLSDGQIAVRGGRGRHRRAGDGRPVFEGRRRVPDVGRRAASRTSTSRRVSACWCSCSCSRG